MLVTPEVIIHQCSNYRMYTTMMEFCLWNSSQSTERKWMEGAKYKRKHKIDDVITSKVNTRKKLWKIYSISKTYTMIYILVYFFDEVKTTSKFNLICSFIFGRSHHSIEWHREQRSSPNWVISPVLAKNVITWLYWVRVPRFSGTFLMSTLKRTMQKLRP